MNFLTDFVAPLITGALAGAVINGIIEWFRGRRKRKAVLNALQVQANRLLGINEMNKTATETATHEHHVVPLLYPVEPFEIALFSADGISVSPDCIKRVTEYLEKANELNALAEIFRNDHFGELSHGPIPKNKEVTRRFFHDQVYKDMPEIIGHLVSVLSTE